ncbi:MAG: SCO family protein [Sandaracinaceae bacterium]|nr:SCO family protein [Sandaracinaceae bacterium]
MRLERAFIVNLFVAAAFLTSPSEAQHRFVDQTGPQPARDVPQLDEIGVDEKLDETIPLDLSFRDHTGKKVQLKDYFDGKRPVLLSFAYHTCDTLCSMVLDATARGIQDAVWTAGKEYQVITISIDPKETLEATAAKRAQLLKAYGRPEADNGWHFLVGDKPEIERITDAFGYRYFYNARSGHYGHPAAIMFLTPDGKIARYLYGLNYNPTDVRMALLEASEGRSISTVEQLILYCYAYDPGANSYALMAFNVMKLGGGLTVLLLGGTLALFWLRERRRGLLATGPAENDEPHQAS